MVELLKKVLDEVAKLSDEEQEAIALLILEELEDERRWNEAFAKSWHILEKLGQQALANHKAGLTEELDPDTL